LNLLLQRGPHSRADGARELQVTRSTASALVAGLVERGLLLEIEETADVERIGRPGFVIKLNPGACTFIGVDIAVSELRIVALDMKADVIASLTVPYTDPATPDYVVGLVRPAVGKLLADNRLEFSVVEGLGVAIPGLVETDGVIVFAPILNWRNVDIKDMIEQAFDVPINLYYDNDANAYAVSEGYRAESGAAGTLAYFLMDSGVGLGVLHQGQVFRGQEGVAGEIGHARFFGGPDFYQAAIIDLEEDALSSDTMVAIFDQMGTIRGFVDDNMSGGDWNLASAMVVRGEAAMQLMGDWAKGAFIAAGLTPGDEIMCTTVPGTEGAFLFNTDFFAMFDVDADDAEAQQALAAGILDPGFQEAFNLVKGSIPARTDVLPENLDAGGQQSISDMAAAAEAGTLMGSMAHGHAQPSSIQGAMVDTVTSTSTSTCLPRKRLKHW
jgi:hypothetical protein